jgi:1,4-dihydroxy-2-naphthoate octaprenyltransferase
MSFLEKPHHHKNAKAVLGLFIVLLAFGILLLFATYKDNIISANAFQPFVILTAIALGLLAGLFFLANQETSKVTHKKASSSKPAKKKKKSSR